MQSIDILKNLQDINFFNTPLETLLADMISEYETKYKEQTGETIKLYPGDPIRIYIYTQALRLYQAYMLLDWSAKQNFLKYAKGSYLDHIAATRFGDKISRAGDSAAITTIRFTLSDIQATPTIIAAGKRVTAGDNVFFITKEENIILTGQTHIDIICECTEAGIIGNGYLPGQIKTLVDPIPYIASVSNLDESQGGADIEDDESFMERIWLGPEGFSVAGPEGAYIYRAKEYSQLIQDVLVYAPDKPKSLSYKIDGVNYTAAINQITGAITGTHITSGNADLATGLMNVILDSPASEFTATIPRGGEVEIRPLLTNGETPTQSFLDGLKEYLSAKDKRPLTDNITVLAPESVNYTINLTYYLDSSKSTVVNETQTAVNSAIQNYILWQKSKLGRALNPSELIRLIVNAGAKRAEIISPVYAALEKYQLAVNTAVNVTYGGLESD